MYNVSTWVVIRIYWKIYVPRASGPLDYIFQYIQITTHVSYQYIFSKTSIWCFEFTKQLELSFLTIEFIFQNYH